MDVIQILERYLGSNELLFKTVLQHSIHVRDRALFLAHQHPEMNLDVLFIEQAAMLHDIGVFLTDAPTIYCFGTLPYICHGYLGREILEKEGLPQHALVCERHTGTGLYLSEIVLKQLPLPHRDLIPISLEEQLICFADKFFSKSQPNTCFTTQDVRQKLVKYGPEGVLRFENWCKMFL